MRLLVISASRLREQGRDLLALSLTLAFGPLFVLLYSLFFPSGSTTYTVLLLDMGHDPANTAPSTMAAEVAQAVSQVAYPGGEPLLIASAVDDRAKAEALLRDREASVLVVLPENLQLALTQGASGQRPSPATITFVGDLTNPYYPVAGVLAGSAIDRYVQDRSGARPVVTIAEEPLLGSDARTEFEIYVPGLLVFSVILLVFLASMTVARDIEAGTLRRLQLTPMTSGEYLGGTTIALVLVGMAGWGLTLGTALLLGFRSSGSIVLATAVGAITAVAIIGVGLILASFCRSVTQAFLLANFPLGLFMFFSGSIFPIPRVPIFTLGGHSFGLYDVLPPTHAVSALNKILTLGAGLNEVRWELGCLAALSAAYFIAGVWVFGRRRLTAQR